MLTKRVLKRTRSHPFAILAAVLLPALVLAGCANTQQSASRPASPNPEIREQSFDEFLDAFGKRAVAEGIRPATVERAFKGLSPNDRLLARLDSQPEFVRPIWDYLRSAASDRRTADGRTRLSKHRGRLRKVEDEYGVPAKIIVAIWGMESNFGRNTGSFSVVQVLATQAWKGRRARWARGELMQALRLLDRREVELDRFKGSWAGAYGQTQFMPSTYRNHAVDGDGDGRRDLIGSLPDVFASTGNLLRHYGWQRGEPWGFEVRLPGNFPWEQAEYAVRKPIAEWSRLGVRRANGRPLTGPGVTAATEASIITPAGHKGPAFVVLKNFRALLRYNNATAYALGVSRLSDKLIGGDALVASWPANEKQLSRSDTKELQERLTGLGCKAGKPDGIVGPSTRKAVRCYQKQLGVPQDGFPTTALLRRLRGAGSS